MRIMRTLFIALFLVGVFSAAAFAEKDTEQKKTKEQAAEQKEFKQQTHCPVMGGKIDSTVFTDIQGQRVYHCCAGCSKPLKKDPDKYFKEAAKEGIIFENIQSHCPVSGKELGEEPATIYYEGRTIAFCCAGCSEPFHKDPQTYLSKLDEQPEDTKDKQEEKEMDHSSGDHSGHGH